MSKKKPSKPSPPVSINPTESNPAHWDFDSLEEKIRGEEELLDAEQKLAKRESELKKELDQSEVDRRLELLRKKIKPPDR